MYDKGSHYWVSAMHFLGGALFDPHAIHRYLDACYMLGLAASCSDNKTVSMRSGEKGQGVSRK